MTENNDYSWQKEAYSVWKKNNFTGVIQAVPGAGKTIAGIRIIQAYKEEFSTNNIVIVAPTHQILRQWEDELTKIGVTYPLFTYFGLLKEMKAGKSFDLIIFDECHRLNADVSGKILEHGLKHYIGLSATPEGIEEKLGKVILVVDWTQANISNFELTYVLFNMSNVESADYAKLTQDVKDAYKFKDYDKNDDNIIITMRRRQFVYNLPMRVNIVMKLLKMYPSERIMIFSERINQLRTLSINLNRMGVKFSVLTSKEDTLQDFIDHKTRILLSSKMVKEGFNDPSVSIGIIASSPLSNRNQIQTIGRIVRNFPGKNAKIYTILAKGTTDEVMLTKGAIEKYKIMDENLNILRTDLVFGSVCDLVYTGKEYNVTSSNEIYVDYSTGKGYLTSDNDTIRSACSWIVNNHGTGKFIITKFNEILSKVDNDVIYLGRSNTPISFAMKLEEGKKLTLNDLFK